MPTQSAGGKGGGGGGGGGSKKYPPGRICKMEGCEKLNQTNCNGLCHAHHTQSKQSKKSNSSSTKSKSLPANSKPSKAKKRSTASSKQERGKTKKQCTRGDEQTETVEETPPREQRKGWYVGSVLRSTAVRENEKKEEAAAAARAGEQLGAQNNNQNYHALKGLRGSIGGNAATAAAAAASSNESGPPQIGNDAKLAKVTENLNSSMSEVSGSEKTPSTPNPEKDDTADPAPSSKVFTVTLPDDLSAGETFLVPTFDGGHNAKVVVPANKKGGDEMTFRLPIPLSTDKAQTRLVFEETVLDKQQWAITIAGENLRLNHPVNARTGDKFMFSVVIPYEEGESSKIPAFETSTPVVAGNDNTETMSSHYAVDQNDEIQSTLDKVANGAKDQLTKVLEIYLGQYKKADDEQIIGPAEEKVNQLRVKLKETNARMKDIKNLQKKHTKATHDFGEKDELATQNNTIEKLQTEEAELKKVKEEAPIRRSHVKHTLHRTISIQIGQKNVVSPDLSQDGNLSQDGSSDIHQLLSDGRMSEFFRILANLNKSLVDNIETLDLGTTLTEHKATLLSNAYAKETEQCLNEMKDRITLCNRMLAMEISIKNIVNQTKAEVGDKYKEEFDGGVADLNTASTSLSSEWTKKSQEAETKYASKLAKVKTHIKTLDTVYQRKLTIYIGDVKFEPKADVPMPWGDDSEDDEGEDNVNVNTQGGVYRGHQ